MTTPAKAATIILRTNAKNAACDCPMGAAALAFAVDAPAETEAVEAEPG
jgi:hypothetical protein